MILTNRRMFFHRMRVCSRNRRHTWRSRPCWCTCRCRTCPSGHIRPCRHKTDRQLNWRNLPRRHTRKSRECFHSGRSDKYEGSRRIRPNLSIGELFNFKTIKQILRNSILESDRWSYLCTNDPMERERILLDIDIWTNRPCWYKYRERTFPFHHIHRGLQTPKFYLKKKRVN